MSYLEIKRVNDTEYVSFVKKFSLMGRSFRIHQHIGKNISTLDSKDYLRRNLDEISKKEFELRRPLIEKLDIAYDKTLLSDIELLAIKINNRLEVKDLEDIILTEFAKEFIFNSNNIEGSKIPAEEVKKIIESGNSRYQNANEVREVYNSIDAIKYIQKGFKFNISSIKKLYYILTKELLMQNGEPYPRGFQAVNNVVNNMETVPHNMVIPRLTDLLDQYRENKRQTHPLKLAMDFHQTYEHIHPFLDGNGRTGRLIMNKILMSQKYFPIIIYSKNSRAYFNSISKGLAGENMKTYYQFMMKQAKKTYKDFYSKIENY
jgi:Fic family protein